jgi:hypothetical protein
VVYTFRILYVPVDEIDLRKGIFDGELFVFCFRLCWLFDPYLCAPNISQIPSFENTCTVQHLEAKHIIIYDELGTLIRLRLYVVILEINYFLGYCRCCALWYATMQCGEGGFGSCLTSLKKLVCWAYFYFNSLIKRIGRSNEHWKYSYEIVLNISKLH